MILIIFTTFILFSSPINGENCEQILTKEQCFNSAIRDAVEQIISTTANPIVASAMIEAIEDASKPATSYSSSAAVNWLCDSAFLKSGNKVVVSGSFSPGKSCQIVTDNIRGLVKVAKIKEINVQAKADVKKREMLQTNNLIVRYHNERKKVTQLRNQANVNKINLQNQANSMSNQANQLQREVNDLAHRINKDGWNNWWRKLFNIYDEKKAALRSKLNSINAVNSHLNSVYHALNSYQSQINQLIVKERTIRTQIQVQDVGLKLLGKQLTTLKVTQNDLGRIAMEWTTTNEKCEDIEDDPILFEDLTDTVNLKVEAQAKKLSTLICNGNV